jgi:hypothetical protein
MRLLRFFPIFRCAVCGTVALLNLLHPFLHGFESGALDAVMVQLDMFAASLINTQEA